jgi:AraC family transcriptional regulator
MSSSSVAHAQTASSAGSAHRAAPRSRADRPLDGAHGLARVDVTRRAWNGVWVDVTEFRGSGEALHPLCFEDEVRITTVLEEIGEGRCEPRTHADKPCSVEYAPHHMDFVPAGMTIWGHTSHFTRVKDATLVFDVPTLEARLGQRLSGAMGDVPRLRFTDEPLWQLLRLLADATTDVDPSTELYGDGLVAAIVGRLLRSPRERPPHRGGLAPWQLRRVTEYLHAHPAGVVTLAELAASVGLSQAHFSRAFKISTGKPPHRFHLELRIERARTLLLESGSSLDDVAAATGFADAPHLGRVFRAVVGTTPGAWRRARR